MAGILRTTFNFFLFLGLMISVLIVFIILRCFLICYISRNLLPPVFWDSSIFRDNTIHLNNRLLLLLSLFFLQTNTFLSYLNLAQVQWPFQHFHANSQTIKTRLQCPRMILQLWFNCTSLEYKLWIKTQNVKAFVLWSRFSFWIHWLER